MASPVIVGADTTNGTEAADDTTWTLTYPANVAIGNLLLACVVSDGYPDITFPAPWTELLFVRRMGEVCLYVAYVYATSALSGTFNLTLDDAEQGAWRIFRITGASTNVPEYATATYDTATPNPPLLIPSWGFGEYLSLAVCGVDGSQAISGYPSDMPDSQSADVSGGADGASLGIAADSDTLSQKDPESFTAGGADEWVAATIMILSSSDTIAVPLTTERRAVFLTAEAKV